MRATPQEARAALDTIDRGRLRVIDEIDLPRWYWLGLAVGWIALGLVTDLGHAWISAAATLLFGAVNAAVAPRAASGRHRTRRLSVSAELAGRHIYPLVIASLLALAALTIAGGFAASADGARDPATIASLFVAMLLIFGGPQVLAAVRRRVVRTATR